MTELLSDMKTNDKTIKKIHRIDVSGINVFCCEIFSIIFKLYFTTLLAMPQDVCRYRKQST